MNPQLISYVRTQRNNGYSDDQIVAALINAGYPQSLAQSAVNAADDTGVADVRMAQAYAQNQQAQGRSQDEIEHELGMKLPKHSKKPLLFIFPLLAGALIASVFFLFSGDTQSQAPEEVYMSDVVENLLSLANSNPEAALALCKRMVSEDQPDCYLTVSRASYDPALCRNIDSLEPRDACYMQFVYDGNLEFCDRLKDPRNIEYCDIVRSLPA